MKLYLGKITLLFCFSFFLSDLFAQKHEWLRVTESSIGVVLPGMINTDSSSSPYIGGIYYTKDSIDLNTGPGKHMVYGTGNYESFHLKLDSNGNFQWANTFEGRANVYNHNSHIDNNNNVFIVGSFYDTIQLSNSTSNATHISKGFLDAIVAKYDQDGEHIWSFSIGGLGDDVIHEVNTDSQKNIYLIGTFMDSVDMDPGTAEYFVYTTSTKNFILKLDSTGNFMWVKLFNLNLLNIGINKFDQLYFSCNITDTSHILTQTGIETFIPKGSNDILFGRMNKKGEIKWVNQLQSIDKINIFNSTHPTDQNGNLHLLGSFSNSINLSSNPNVLHLSQGKSNGFICKFDTSGNEIWFKTFGGKGSIHTHALTIDGLNNLYFGIESYVVGKESYDKLNFQTDNGRISVNTPIKSSIISTFIIKFNKYGSFKWAKAIHGGPTIEAISWNSSNDIYSTGAFSQIEFQDSMYYGNWTDLYVIKTSICDPLPFYDTLYLCAGDSSFIPNIQKEHAGNYSQLVENNFGCDSLRNTHLIVYPSYTDTSLYSFCKGDSLLYKGKYYREDTTFIFKAATRLGCDSSRTVLIQMDNTLITEINIQICDGDTFYFNKQSYFESGKYLDTLTSIIGCDSIIQIDLKVNPKSQKQQNVSICANKVYKIGNSIYQKAGTYIDTLINHWGCDSIVTTYLSIDSLPSSEQFVIMCPGGSYKIGKSTYEQAGIYTDTLTRFPQCDSIVVSHISIAQNADSSINFEICEGDSVVFNHRIYRQTGSNVQTIDFGSCQLKLTINVNVLAVKRKSQTFDLCVGDSLWLDNKLYFKSGSYYNTYQTNKGCDSIVETIINIPEFSVGLDDNSLNIITDDSYENVQFLWYNCDSKRILYEETSKRFELKFTGNYAPIIIMDGCRDTLTCNQYTYDGDYKLKLFPNPAKTYFTIAVPTAGKMRLLNSNGSLVKEHYFHTSREYNFQIENIAAGIYFIFFEGEKGLLTEKLSIVR